MYAKYSTSEVSKWQSNAGVYHVPDSVRFGSTTAKLLMFLSESLSTCDCTTLSLLTKSDWSTLSLLTKSECHLTVYDCVYVFV